MCDFLEPLGTIQRFSRFTMTYQLILNLPDLET